MGPFHDPLRTKLQAKKQLSTWAASGTAKSIAQEKGDFDFKLDTDNCWYNYHHHSADDTECQGKVGPRWRES